MKGAGSIKGKAIVRVDVDDHQSDATSVEALEGSFTWPPRAYNCTFCKREFRSAQALGGHMNVHRRDRALLRETLHPSTDDHINLITLGATSYNPSTTTPPLLSSTPTTTITTTTVNAPNIISNNKSSSTMSPLAAYLYGYTANNSSSKLPSSSPAGQLVDYSHMYTTSSVANKLRYMLPSTPPQQQQPAAVQQTNHMHNSILSSSNYNFEYRNKGAGVLKRLETRVEGWRPAGRGNIVVKEVDLELRLGYSPDVNKRLGLISTNLVQAAAAGNVVGRNGSTVDHPHAGPNYKAAGV